MHKHTTLNILHGESCHWKNREEFYCKLEDLINIIYSDPAITWTMKQEKSVSHTLLTWCSVIKHNPSPVLLQKQIFDDASGSS